MLLLLLLLIVVLLLQRSNHLENINISDTNIAYIHDNTGCTEYICTFQQMLITIGHRFGHQSGLVESSGQHSAAICNVFVIRTYLMLSEIGPLHIEPILTSRVT